MQKEFYFNTVPLDRSGSRSIVAIANRRAGWLTRYRRSMMTLLVTVLFGWGLGVGNINFCTTVSAQDLLLNSKFGELGVSDEGNSDSEDPVKMTAEFKLKTDSRLGVLFVHTQIAEHFHVYSVTQKNGGPIRSKIAVVESGEYTLVGKFTPDAPPHVVESEVFDVPIEDHEGSVVWSVPIQLAEDVDPSKLTIKVNFDGQVCEANVDGETIGCKNLAFELEAKFGGYDDALEVVEPAIAAVPADKVFKSETSHIQFKGQVVRADGIRAVIAPGDKITLELTAEPTDGFHIYGYEFKQTDPDQYPTVVAFTHDNGWQAIKPRVSEEPKENEEMGYLAHEDPVTWSFDFNIPADAEKKNYTLTGLIGFQTCSNMCDRPDGLKFSVAIPVGTASPPIPVEFEDDADYPDAQNAIDTSIKNPAKKKTSGTEAAITVGHKDSPEVIAEMATYYDAESKIKYLTLDELDANPPGTVSKGLVRRKKSTFWTTLAPIFFGGMLLNLMPCVFPVLGLKVMGFVEQAGSDPKKIRMHGIVFAAGLVASMWVLAGIILSLKLVLGRNVSWGAEQMGNPYFVVSIIVLLFLLGLNMAGVFEIGTSLTRVGGSSGGKKGYGSSFLSGILTTLIATPCSGPFLGAAMGYTLSQPPHIAMFLFTVFALGIAFPYIALSFFPALISRLPRPGAWMHTFKVTMAFALFATVAFFMQSFGAQTGVDGLSWLAMALVVLGLAAFFYGTWSPAYVKPFKRILFGWVMPGVIAAAGLWMCYDAANYRTTEVANHHAGGINWQPWNPGKVEYLLDKKKKIVWVDYTADW